MSLRKFVYPTIDHLAITVLLAIGFLLTDFVSLYDAEKFLIFVVLSYLLAGVLRFAYLQLKPKIFNKMIAFDAGGVYFTGDYWTEKQKQRPGFNDLLKKLRPNAVVVMLTNNNVDVSKWLEKKFNLDLVFDDVISSGDLKVKKPDTKIYKLLATKFGLQPKNIIFVDDDKTNVDAASSIGIKGIHFQSIEQLKSDLAKLGIKV